MTKIRITGFENITPRIKTKILQAINTSKYSQELTQDIIEEVRKNGVKPELSPSTVKTRKYLKGYNSTHPDFEPGKSNLTITGQLLDSLRGKPINRKFIIIIDSLSKKHSRYKTATNKGKSALPSLKQIFQWQKEAGRDIAQVFTRSGFLDKITNKLKQAILKNYRN